VILAGAALRALLMWSFGLGFHMPPLRPFASSAVLGFFPFAYLYLLLGGLASREVFYVALDAPRAVRALSLFVFLLPFFVLEEASFGVLIRKYSVPAGFLMGSLSKLLVLWAVAASVLLDAAPLDRTLVLVSLPLLTALLLLLQMFTVFVARATENSTIAAGFGAMTLSWFLATLYPLT
jgi:hypothetical protein